MDDALLMRCCQRLGDLSGDGERFVDFERALRNAVRECRSVDELHHQRMDVGGVIEPVDLGNVGVTDGGENLRFTPEPRQAFGIRRKEVGQHLDGDITVQLGVAGAKHLAHPARAESGQDLVGTELRATGQGHSSRPSDALILGDLATCRPLLPAACAGCDLRSSGNPTIPRD